MGASQMVSRLALVRTGILALVLGLCAVLSLGETIGPAAAHAKSSPASTAPRFKSAVIILDSAGLPMASDPALMPFLVSLAAQSQHGRANACPSLATFPCIKTLLEGRAAAMGTTLQNFSADASVQPNWPASLATLGLRIAVVSDNTLNRLYPASWTVAFNYDTVALPLLERDRPAMARAREWLATPSLDAHVIHFVGTDKVAHERPTGGPEYRAKFREADDFVAEVSAALGPDDYLFVLSDHGHISGGGHSADAIYFARGPLFPAGMRRDIEAIDVLPLLSIPYDLPLPLGFQGTLATADLRWAEAERQRYLSRQAVSLGLASTAGADELEAAINRETSERRRVDLRAERRRETTALVPWLATGLLVLLARWRVWRRADGARIWQLAAAGLVLVALGFWVAPALLEVYGANHGLGTLVAFALALVIAAAASWLHGRADWRERVERVLLGVVLLVWLFFYFGVYFFSVARMAPLALLIALPLAALARAGIAPLWSARLLGLAALVPLMAIHAESFNMDFTLLRLLARRSPWEQAAAIAAIGAVYLWIVRAPARKAPIERSALAAAVLGLWAVVAVELFQFSSAAVVGFLCAAVALASLIGVAERARLSPCWTSLAAAVSLLLAEWVAFNGFALSHVDFRFAVPWLIPLEGEQPYAAQLIAWAFVKYSLPLVPALAVLWRTTARGVAGQLLFDLVLWRLFTAALMTLGLRLFDHRGMHELAGEELFFWSALALITFVTALVLSARRESPHGRATRTGSGRFGASSPSPA